MSSYKFSSIHDTHKIQTAHKTVIQDVRLNGMLFVDLHDLPYVVTGCLHDGQQKTMDVGRSGRVHRAIKQRIPRADFNVKLVKVEKIRVRFLIFSQPLLLE